MTRLLLALTFAYLLAVVLLAGCRPRPASAPAATDTAVAPTATVAMPTDTPTTEPATVEPTSTPAATATPRPAATPAGPTTGGTEEAILVLEPGPGSRVTSPVRIAGEADPTFEQNLAVRILPLDGSQLALEPATIAAELGERGPFALEIPFSVQEEQQALIQVLASSARDGGVTHLSSVMVTLLPEGDAEVVPATPHPERIAITTPEVADTVTGGVVHVEGVALASFEQTLIVELLDAEGDVVASEPVIVDAPDLGEPGPFSIDLPYAVATAGPGRIVVRDPSPALDADVHLSSVEITLEPERRFTGFRLRQSHSRAPKKARTTQHHDPPHRLTRSFPDNGKRLVMPVNIRHRLKRHLPLPAGSGCSCPTPPVAGAESLPTDPG